MELPFLLKLQLLWLKGEFEHVIQFKQRLHIIQLWIFLIQELGSSLWANIWIFMAHMLFSHWLLPKSEQYSMAVRHIPPLLDSHTFFFSRYVLIFRRGSLIRYLILIDYIMFSNYIMFPINQKRKKEQTRSAPQNCGIYKALHLNSRLS